MKKTLTNILLSRVNEWHQKQAGIVKKKMLTRFSEMCGDEKPSAFEKKLEERVYPCLAFYEAMGE